MRVLMLHAFPVDAEMWRRQELVLEGLHAVASSLYGRGNSFDEIAASLLAEFEDDLCLVGASFGGGCALAMARQAPERIRGILLAGAHAGADPPERRAAREEMIALVRAHGPEAIWQGQGSAPTAAELIAAAEALRDRPDDRAVVARFPGPLLVVGGGNDPLIEPEAARALAESAPRGRFVLLERAGHLVSVDCPEQFNRHLQEFLAECA
jgi:pimeloyl-ACP methyl ester carboxylesterase